MYRRFERINKNNKKIVRELRYLKLFEAFDSSKIAKTLASISDKDKFIEQLKLYCNAIDFPYSKLTDEYFEYLPYNKALKKTSQSEPTKCDAQSNTIPGEFCKDGKIKKKWGESTRTSKCTVCKGTGFKPSTTSDLKYLKFWFDKDGKLIIATGVDGTVNLPDIFNGKKYKVASDKLQHDRVMGLKTGDVVKIRIFGKNIIAYIYRCERSVFALQSHKDGATPSDYGDNKWKEIKIDSMTPKAWSIDGVGDYSDAFLLKEDDNDGIDPYDFNYLLDSNIKPLKNNPLINNGYTSSRNKLRDAHFAIIMDFDKLTSYKYTSIENIGRLRKNLQSGSLSDKNYSPELVRKQNKERYLKKLSGITSERYDRLIKRGFGQKNIIYFLFNTVQISRLNRIISKLRDTKPDLDSISTEAYQFLNSSTESNRVINNNLMEIKRQLNGQSHFKKAELRLKLFDDFEKFGEALNNKISSYDIKSIKDLENAAILIRSFHDKIYKNLRGLADLMNHIKNVDGGYVAQYNHIADYYTDSEIKKIIRTVSELKEELCG